MVRKLIKTRSGLSVADMFGVGITKVFSERLLAPLVGNANITSGLVKLGGAFFIPQMAGGKIGTILGTALAVDGVEDIISSVIGGGLLGGGLLGGDSGIEVI